MLDKNVARAAPGPMADFMYPGQVIDETGREVFESFTDRIKGKYIAEKVLVEKVVDLDLL